MVDWQARRQAQDTVDGDLIDISPLVDSINKFADSATIIFDDPTGDKKSNYPRGQRVELEYSTDGGNTFTRRFAGLVQDVTERSDGGADKLEVKLVGYDYLLRIRTIYKSYSSSSLSTILEDIIKTFTPVNYVAGNVSFSNDKTIDLTLDGQRVDEALSRIASESGDEDYGVNDDLEFFFEKRETSRAPSDIIDGDWTDYNLPEQGRDSVNRVELFYGSSGSESRVIVDDRAAQRDLKNKLNAAGNVVISEEKTFPEISTEDEAKSKAREILNNRSEILTGTVTTFSRFGVEAGDVFRLQIGDKNIDADFRVAQIEYQWVGDETVVTVAENTGDVEDLLVQLADDVRRIDSRAADPSASFTQFLQLQSGVTASPDPGFTDVSIDSDAFLAGFANSFAGFGSPDTLGFLQTTTDNGVLKLLTYKDDVLIAGFGGSNTSTAGFANQQAGFARAKSTSQAPVNSSAVTTGFLNQLRDVWQGESATTISHVAVGTDSSDAVSTDTALDAEAGRSATLRSEQPASVEIELAGRVISDGTISDGGISEFGFFDSASGGTMYLSGQNDSIDPTRRSLVQVRVVVTIDTDSEQFGVITTKGQERLVDLFLGNTGHEPSDIAFGTGTSDTSESDTSLGSKVTEKSVSFADRQRGQSDVTARLATGDANGNDLAELGEENSSNELLSRLVFETIAKDSDFALDANHIFSARNA